MLTYSSPVHPVGHLIAQFAPCPLIGSHGMVHRAQRPLGSNPVKLHRGLSVPRLPWLFDSEVAGEAAQQKARWQACSLWSRCGGREHGLAYGRRLKGCRHRTSDGQHGAHPTGPIRQGNKLPLSNGCLAFSQSVRRRLEINTSKVALNASTTSIPCCCITMVCGSSLNEIQSRY